MHEFEKIQDSNHPDFFSGQALDFFDTWTLKIWNPWLDQAPNDPNCNNGEFCDYDNYRKFIALKNVNPDFVPMISIGKLNKNKKSLFTLWIVNI